MHLHRTLACVAALLLAVVAQGSAAGSPLPYADAGPYAVVLSDVVELPARDDARAIPLRIAYPDADGPWPMIVFSHGMFSSNEKYMPIVEHWVSHGFVVLLPNHVDANRGVKVRGTADVEGIIRSRAADMSVLLDQLTSIIESVPAIKGQIAPAPYVAAGHSVGTYVAMLANGLAVRNPQSGEITKLEERRYGAVVMSSDPGKMALMPADLWLGVTVPTFLATGTEDYGVMGDGNAPTTYESEVLTGEGAPDGSKYLLLIDGADHYFGGLVHRAPENVTPDPEGLAIFNALSTAFLSAYAKQHSADLNALRTRDVTAATGGRARLEIR